ncbi:hypothetical protein B0T25DRAFT_564480 [Lasiosphaeria hispida]|uniref:Uncharacterized protein n=1 Tax=Lasiosphaeria hispida TaxID=260671 RepID=A0AAJ0MHP1_9PEZI|nr:hypothetical protein B0T25DRAFT_564480 [Lasiosphaeria hispida]
MATEYNLTVYTGVCRDSQDGTKQLTLTLPLRWANILSSVLALLVAVAGGGIWRIAACALHQIRVRHATQSDPLRQQVQTLLRNNVTAVSALVDAVRIMVAWA